MYVDQFGSKRFKQTKKNINKYDYLGATSVVFVDDMKGLISSVLE